MDIFYINLDKSLLLDMFIDVLYKVIINYEVAFINILVELMIDYVVVLVELTKLVELISRASAEFYFDRSTN